MWHNACASMLIFKKKKNNAMHKFAIIPVEIASLISCRPAVCSDAIAGGSFLRCFWNFIKTLRFGNAKSFVRESVRKREYKRYVKTNWTEFESMLSHWSKTLHTLSPPTIFTKYVYNCVCKTRIVRHVPWKSTQRAMLLQWKTRSRAF